MRRIIRPPLFAILAVLLGGLVLPAAAAPQAGAPHYDHVFELVEENHGFDQIIGNPAAPTLNRLADAYGYASHYYGVTHPSGPNYVAMLGGGTFGVTSDNAYWLFNINQPSLMSQLDAAGKSWRGYLQGMPYPGYRGYCYPVRCLGVPDSDTLYIAKHNGLAYFNGIRNNPSEMAKMQPLGQLTTDLNSGNVPNFSYIMPDECTDMHGAPPVCVDSGDPGDVNDNWLVTTADTFIAKTVAQISSSRVWASGNNAIVITFDEGDGGDNSGCCGSTQGGGRALTVVITNHGQRHQVDATPYNHYSLLSGLQHVFGLGCLAATCDTADIKPITPLFAVDPNQPAQPVPASLLDGDQPPPPVTGSDQGTVAPVSAPAPAPGGSGHWQVIPSPNLSGNDNNLAAVSAPAANNAWAVGNYYTDANPNVFRNLALHWDGTRWTAIAPPNVGIQENTLFGVSALPTGQAWAAGYYADANYHIRTLIEHYDGSSWTVVPSLNPGAERDMLFAISARADNDVWAVGGSQDAPEGTFHTLVEHWDGHAWSVLPSPNPGPKGNELFGVTLAGSQMWAVGQQQNTGFPGKALIERWDGHAWSVIPASGTETYDPYAATAMGDRVLVAGDRENDKSPQRTLAITVTGRTATAAEPPTVGTSENDFYGVTSLGGMAWAAGRSTDSDPNVQNHVTLIESLVNGRWTVQPTPNPGGAGGDNGFGGIAAAPNATVWAVGAYRTASSSNETLIERYVP
ncbi:MAG TPA: alkaline phosphatase family protein [Pseudonocardiaceae bacterium]|nr:alkaline phosphatase family protein [Pseudonocardiaceae bacterium]